MLTSFSETEWTEAYKAARVELSSDLSKLQKLDEIYNNPSYYAGWKLREIKGNLGIQGSVAAEQNHASVVAFLGKGASWCISRQVSKLIQRNLQQEKERHKIASSYRVQVDAYTSDFHGDFAKIDERAKTILSRYAYDKLFRVQFAKAKKMTCTESPDGDSWVVSGYTCSRGQEEPGQTFLKQTGCGCYDFVTYDFPCCHQICADGYALVETKINSRWFSQHAFDVAFPTFRDSRIDWRSTENDQGLPSDPPLEIGEDDDEVSILSTNSIGTSGTAGTAATVRTSASAQSWETNDSTLMDRTLLNMDQRGMDSLTISFSKLISQFEVLARYVSNDRARMLELSDHLKIVSGRIRTEESLSVIAWNNLNPPLELGEKENFQPMKSVGRPIANATGSNRKRSYLEIHRGGRTPRQSNKRNAVTLSQRSNDQEHCVPGRKGTKTCGWCGLSGHQRNNCPKANRFKSPSIGVGKSSVPLRY